MPNASNPEANNVSNDPAKSDEGIRTGSETRYNPSDNTSARGEVRDPKYALAHELSHAEDNDIGNNVNEKNEGKSNGIPDTEIKAVNFENRIRSADGFKLRTSYGDQRIPSDCLDDPCKPN